MLESFSQGTLLLVGIIGFLLWIGVMLKVQVAKIVLVLMIFVASIGVALNWRGGYLGSWLLPLQIVRSDLFLALGILLLLTFVGIAGRISIERTSFQAWFLLVIGLYQGLLRVIHETPVDGAISMGYTMATIFPVMLIVPALLRKRSDWYGLLRMIMLANVVWLSCCTVQLFLNPTKLMIPGLYRFYGVGANPIFASTYLVVPTVVSLWLFFNDPKWRFRWIWILLFGVNAILVLATGSRSGVLYCVIGITAVTYRRWGRSALLLPLAFLSVIGALRLVEFFGVTFAFERVVSLEDTRTQAWLALIEEGFASPLIGNGTGGVSKSENSYLYGFASFGIPMFVLMTLFLLASMVHCLRLLNASRAHPQWRSLIDMMIGFNAIYFANSMLDGIILARTDSQLMNMLIFSAMSATFIRAVKRGEVEELEDGEMEPVDEEWAEEEYPADLDYGLEPSGA